MKEATRNYYYQFYIRRDKEYLVEEILRLKELCNQLEITKIDEENTNYIRNIEYSVYADYKKENEQLKREIKLLNMQLDTALDMYDEVLQRNGD